jgi:hypothetical protein
LGAQAHTALSDILFTRQDTHAPLGLPLVCRVTVEVRVIDRVFARQDTFEVRDQRSKVCLQLQAGRIEKVVILRLHLRTVPALPLLLFPETALLGNTVIHHIVYYDNNVSAVDIRNNTIGGSNSSNTGSYTLTTTSSGQPSFRGIYIVNASLTTASNIQGNTIKNIVLSTYSNSTLFIGIYVGSGYVDVGNISGNTIGSSTTTGSISIDSKYNSGSVSFYGIYSPSSYVVNISNNTIGSVNFGYSGSGANTMYFYSIIYYFAGGSTTFSNNIIGSAVTSNSIRIGPSSGTGTGNYYFFGIYNYMSAANSSIVQYNTISNIFINCSGSSSYAYGLYNYAGVTATYSIDNNNISNITTASSLTASPSIYGIYLYTTGSGCTISRNTISGLYNTNSSASTRVVGIYHYYSTGYNDIKENIIKSIGCFSNSNDASAWAIYLNNGYTRVINNFIHLNDNYSSNITGIEIFSGAGHSIYYNTILIEGTHSYTGTSSCLKRNNIPTIAQNNIFFNKRTSSGANYSFTNNTSVFTNTTINYNLHVVNNVTSAIYHNGAGRSWTVYSAANTNDRFSWCENSTNLAATSLFTNTSTSNLTINSSNSACWYVNGKGWPVSGIQYDWEGNIGDERSQAVNGGGTDIGADEFNTSTTPPAATASAARQQALQLLIPLRVKPLPALPGQVAPTYRPQCPFGTTAVTTHLYPYPVKMHSTAIGALNLPPLHQV